MIQKRVVPFIIALILACSVHDSRPSWSNAFVQSKELVLACAAVVGLTSFCIFKRWKTRKALAPFDNSVAGEQDDVDSAANVPKKLSEEQVQRIGQTWAQFKPRPVFVYGFSVALPPTDNIRAGHEHLCVLRNILKKHEEGCSLADPNNCTIARHLHNAFVLDNSLPTVHIEIYEGTIDSFEGELKCRDYVQRYENALSRCVENARKCYEKTAEQFKGVVLRVSEDMCIAYKDWCILGNHIRNFVEQNSIFSLKKKKRIFAKLQRIKTELDPVFAKQQSLPSALDKPAITH